MNQIRAIQALNKKELEQGISPEASWHTDYRDTAFVSFGSLPFTLSEGDVLAIFSQYGEPVWLKLVRDQETGKSRGFGWLKYEDQRSCDLAVDNLGGAEVSGRLIRVDHARYKMRDDEDPEEGKVGWEDMMRRERREKGLPSEDEDNEDEEMPDRDAVHRPLIREERELAKLIEEHDEDDPMKEFLIEEKKQEVEEALRKSKRTSDKDRERGHKHRNHHRSHRSREVDSGDGRRDRDRRHDSDGERERSRRDQTPVAEDARRGETSRARDRERSPGRRHKHRDDDDDRERDRHHHRDRDRDEKRDHDRNRDGKDQERRRERRRDDRGRGDSHKSKAMSRSPRDRD